MILQEEYAIRNARKLIDAMRQQHAAACVEQQRAAASCYAMG
jgi:hypothetical protein